MTKEETVMSQEIVKKLRPILLQKERVLKNKREYKLSIAS